MLFSIFCGYAKKKFWGLKNFIIRKRVFYNDNSGKKCFCATHVFKSLVEQYVKTVTNTVYKTRWKVQDCVRFIFVPVVSSKDKNKK